MTLLSMEYSLLFIVHSDLYIVKVVQSLFMKELSWSKIWPKPNKIVLF